ncbi:molybdopterin molybdenumtransferase MoeA [Aeromicrobium phragmitis]|uniref:Molybdopterin molybdenumtransferase n=1 Tax=Aeromicrobium phragmitis TaxID=2478914 RepID=A0A3L8PK15_9ACTN|nr:gephyrin-like molybdotransferase Glp [Aeromicrobium phragmitis]RLV54938.1 molybdopterin molybdenumtransferase MoeA [Aeromicrobium phragmitis]
MTLRTVAEHRERVLAVLPTRHRTRRVPLEQAHGLVLAAPATAQEAVPRFDNAAMDGYAVRHADLRVGGVLTVVGEVRAGVAPAFEVAAGQAARIMTGAFLPEGADTVVPFELTDDGRDQVRIDDVPDLGRHIRRAAEDVEVGDLVAESGVVVDALTLAALAATGVADVLVVERPRVAVISTGSELCPPGAPLGAGQIPESNSLMIAGLVEEAGADVVSRTSVPDDPWAVETAVRAAEEAEADLVVLSGGVSAGDYDVVRLSLADRLEFVGVAMSPGRPQGVGLLGDLPVVAVPGNPVAAAVSVEVFVRPAVLTLAGRRETTRPVMSALASQGWTSKGDREQYTAVRLELSENGAWAHPLAPGSHRAGSLAAVEGWAVVPLGTSAVRRGDRVDVLVVR